MEELFEEIARQLAENNKTQNAVLATKLGEIQEILEKMTNSPTQTIKLDSGQISREIKAHLDGLNIRIDDSTLISALKEELKKHDRVLSNTKDEIANLSSVAHESIRAVRSEKHQEMNVRLNLQKDFYGFTGWRPFVVYIGTLSLALSFAVYSWFKNSDDERLIEEKARVSEFRKRVEILRSNNPKTAKKYFY